MRGAEKLRYHREVPPKSPLPQRYGIDAARLRTFDRNGEETHPWATMRHWLIDFLPDYYDIDKALAAGEFVYENGEAVTADDPYRPQTFMWVHREFPDETVVPGEIRVVYRDERIVVVDKPAFLSSIPRGRHVRQSVVARMREELGLSGLAPMHRLDRVTSGLLMLTTEQRWRGIYQMLLQRDEVTKVYRAIAPMRDDLELPMTISNHIFKQRGILRAEVLPEQAPNSESLVELAGEVPAGATPPMFAPVNGSGDAVAGVSARLAEYRLTPRTGKTHQLRLHMAGLGVPIVGDPIYPVTRDVAVDDFSMPLQLLASELRFVDPVDGSLRQFVSDRAMPLGLPI